MYLKHIVNSLRGEIEITGQELWANDEQNKSVNMDKGWQLKC